MILLIFGWFQLHGPRKYEKQPNYLYILHQLYLDVQTKKSFIKCKGYIIITYILSSYMYMIEN